MSNEHADWIAGEIDRLRRRYRSQLREVEPARELRAQWTVSGEVLRWHVPLEAVPEPDIDVEILAEALVLRACLEPKPRSILQALLPVPEGYDIGHPAVRCEAGYVEIRLYRLRTEGRAV